jgi:hypothetical protein
MTSGPGQQQFNTFLQLGEAGITEDASGDLARLPLAALLIMLNQTVLLSSLMNGHFWTLQHDKHVSMFVKVGACTYFFALILPVCPWPPYNMPFNRSQVPGNLRR